jgi:competence protein ComEA
VFARVDGQALKVIGLVGAAVLVGVLVGRPQPSRTAPVSVDPPPIAAGSPADVIVIHLSGEVVSPGLVEVASDARVADVIAAAGGVTVRADLASVNLAEPVVDGQQIVIPSTRLDNTGADGVGSADSRIRINDADTASLESLPGVGPVLAEAILAHRAEYGPFRSAEDLLDVPGIGEQKLASLRDRIIVP